MSNSNYGAIPTRRSSIAPPSKDELNKAIGRVSLSEITPLDDDETNPAYQFMSKVMSYMTFLSYLPLFLPLFFDDMELAITITLGFSIFNMAVEYYWYTLGGSKIAFRVLSSSFVVSYGIIFFLSRDGVLTPQNQEGILGRWYDAWVNGLLFVSLTVAAHLDHSFVKDAMSDMMSDAQLSHPIVLHISKDMTRIWMFTFFLLFIVGLIGDPGYLTPLCFVGAGSAQAKYGVSFRETIDEKLELYKDEIEAWNQEHPDAEAPFGL